METKGELEKAPVKPARRGGVRPGAGRKRQGYILKAGGDATYARSLVRTLMRDEAQPMALRVRCALAVLRAKAPGGRTRRKSIRPGE